MTHLPPRRTWTIVLFSITTILLFADQNLMAPNLTDIADEFGFDDEERDRKLGGDISLAFFLLGAPASLVIGCLADSSDRSVIFAWTVFLGEGACLATIFVSTYQQLYVLRAVTGFSVGGAIPLIYSILGDLFAAEDRHVVSAVVSFGTGAGIAVGQAVAGFLGPAFGWRVPFVVVAIPALVTAAAVLFTVPDPERGAMEKAATGYREVRANGDVALVSVRSSCEINSTLGDDLPDTSAIEDSVTYQTVGDLSFARDDNSEDGLFHQEMESHWHTLIKLVSTRTVLLAILQAAPGCIPWGVINVFLNDFLAENRGFTVPMATTTLMFFSVGNGLGLFLGGAAGRKLYQMDKRYPAILAGVAAIGACFPLWLLFNMVDVTTTYWKVVFIAMSAGFASGPTGPIVKATLTNVTHPRARGQAFAFFNLFDDFGKGLGPFFVSLLIAHMGGRLPAFNVSIIGWIVCGLANLAIFVTVERDEAAMVAAMASQNHRGALTV